MLIRRIFALKTATLVFLIYSITLKQSTLVFHIRSIQLQYLI